jgi:hypothetical protein
MQWVNTKNGLWTLVVFGNRRNWHDASEGLILDLHDCCELLINLGSVENKYWMILHKVMK